MQHHEYHLVLHVSVLTRSTILVITMTTMDIHGSSWIYMDTIMLLDLHHVW